MNKLQRVYYGTMGVVMALALLTEQHGRGQSLKEVREIIEEYTIGGELNNNNSNSSDSNLENIVEERCEAKENICKEPKSYTIKELQQLDLEELHGYYADLGDIKKKDKERLNVLVNHKSQINEERILEAIIKVESGGNFLISSRGNGAGLMQLTRPAVTSTLATLYSGRETYKEFNERHSLEVTMKRECVDSLTDNYFADLARVVERISDKKRTLKNTQEVVAFELQEARRDDIGTGEVEQWKLQAKKMAQEQKRLEVVRKTIVNGYLTENKAIKKKYTKTLAMMKKDKQLNEYLSEVVGIKKDWKEYIGKQQKMMDYVMHLTREVEYPELNILMGDVTLAKEIDYFKSAGRKFSDNPLRHATQAYNEGRYGYIERGAGKASAPYYGKFVSIYRSLFGTMPPKFPSTTVHKMEQPRKS